MERPSDAPPSRVSTWKRLLITVSILPFWIHPKPAQSATVSVVPNPPYGTMGSSITLDIQGFSRQALGYTWYRRSVETHNQIADYSVPSGEQRPPADIRYRVLSNGSLFISNLSFSDSGDYFIQIVDSTTGVIERGQGHLSVYEPLYKPTISSTNTAPVEKMDNVSLTCQTLSKDVTFQWITPKGSPANDRIELSPDNRTLTIINVSREDQGPYQCGIRNPVGHILSDPFTLTVTETQSSKVGLVVGIMTGIIVVGLCILGLYCLKTRRCPCDSSSLLARTSPSRGKNRHHFSPNENRLQKEAETPYSLEGPVQSL